MSVADPVENLAFEGIDAGAGRAFADRVNGVLRSLPAGNTPLAPRWMVADTLRFPLDPTGAAPSALSPTPILLFPSPDQVRAALGQSDASPASLASTRPESAVSLLFRPGVRTRDRVIAIPSPIGHPISPGITRHADPRPWRAMGRIVVVVPNPAAGTSLDAVAAEIAHDANIHPDARLWSIPLNDRVALAVFEEQNASRSWIAYPVLDGVAARPNGHKSHSMPDGESAYTVPLLSAGHDPRASGYPLLRLPAANRRTDGERYDPGERIALDEWFADAARGFAIILHGSESIPGRPMYVFSTDLNDLRTARNRIEALCLFPTIHDDMLKRVLEAYRGAELP